MIFIFIQSALPGDISGMESGFFVSLIRQFWDADPETISYAVRKCGHFLEYLALGFSLVFAMDLKLKGVKCMAAAWAAGTAYAVTDEIHQMYSEGRSAQVTDVMIDSAGVLSGAAIAMLILFRRKRKTRDESNAVQS